MQAISSARPSPGLESIVFFYTQRNARCPHGMIVHPVPARSAHAIEFTFRGSYVVHSCETHSDEVAPASVIVGPQTYRRVELMVSGSVEAFAIFFQPTGIYDLFGVPGYSLTNQHHSLPSVAGNLLAELESRLGNSRSFAGRVAIANDLLTQRAQKAGAANSISSQARQILRCQGAVSVSRLAFDSGISIRQLERRFNEQVGLPPKMYARVVRFESALQVKSKFPRCSWTDVAQQLGYYDQMHMIHDFQSLAGDKPSSVFKDLEVAVAAEAAAIS